MKESKMNQFQSLLSKSAVTALLAAAALSGCTKSSASNSDNGGNGGAEAGSGGGGESGSGKGGTGGKSTSRGGSSAGGASSTSSTETIPGTLALAVSEPNLRVIAGQSVVVPVTIVRGGSFTGEVTAIAQGLPAGVGFTATTIGKGSTSAELQVQPGVTASVGGPFNFTIEATSLQNPEVTAKLSAVLYVAQAPGVLDSSFGSSGIVTMKDIVPATSAGASAVDNPVDIAVDAKSRAIVGGYSNADTQRGWVLRLSATGPLDSSFADNGKSIGFGQPTSHVQHLAVSGSTLYVAADQMLASTPWTAYLRALSDVGTGVPAFNGGLDATLTGTVTAMAAFKGGVLVAAGVPAFFGSNGKLDTSFSAASTVVADVLSVDAQDRVLVGASNQTSSFTISRLLPTGAMDPAFGNSGVSSLPCPTDSGKPYPSSIKALLASSTLGAVALVNCSSGARAGVNAEGAFVALSPAGGAVTSFGQSGRRVVVASGWSIAAIPQSDGKLVELHGYMAVENATEVAKFQLGRYDASGALDTTFGKSGFVDITGFTPSAMAYDAQARRAVVVGNVNGGSAGIAIVRVWL